MRTLRLGTVHLEPKDVAYVRALVRLFAHTEKLSWAYAETAPYDAVMTMASTRLAQPAFFDDFKGVVLTLVGTAGSHNGDTIAHPIRADEFREWLRQRQTGLLDASAAPPAPATPQSVPAPAPVDRVADKLLPASASAGMPADSAPGIPRFKLRRWPGADVLGDDPLALRMATLMSRKALSTPQLAALTTQTEESCRRFIALLQGAGLLLEVAPAVVAAGVPAGAARTSQQAPGQSVAQTGAAPAKTGLMASLRRRLGL